MIQTVRLFYKLPFFMCLSGLLVFGSGIISISVFHKKYRRKCIAYLTYILLKSMTKVFGFKVRVTGWEKYATGEKLSYCM